MGNEIDHKKVVGEYVTLYESLKNISCPTICKTIDGATYIARMHFNSTTKTNIEDKLIRLMGEEIKKEI